MSVARVNKDTNFTVMSNVHLRDTRLSLKAIGLLSIVLSLPDNWDYSIEGLTSIVNGGRTVVKTALDELKENGYLVVTKVYPEKGKSRTIEYVYDFYETPVEQHTNNQAVDSQGIDSQGIENLVLENLAVENLAVESLPIENQTQINTDKINKDNQIQSKEEKKKNGAARTAQDSRHKYGEYGNVLLSDEDVEKLQHEFPSDWQERIERLSEYIASTGKKYKNHLATIRSWARKEKQGGKASDESQRHFCGNGTATGTGNGSGRFEGLRGHDV